MISKPRRSSYHCVDCGGTRHPMFMVHDELWTKAGYHQSDIACRPCFEKRIGRKLEMEDYTLVPLNFREVPGFATDERYRLLFTRDGLDYDQEKAAYFALCERLGIKPRWVTSESSQTPQSSQ
jgi:hypothetical protein